MTPSDLYKTTCTNIHKSDSVYTINTSLLYGSEIVKYDHIINKFGSMSAHSLDKQLINLFLHRNLTSIIIIIIVFRILPDEL